MTLRSLLAALIAVILVVPLLRELLILIPNVTWGNFGQQSGPRADPATLGAQGNRKTKTLWPGNFGNLHLFVCVAVFGVGEPGQGAKNPVRGRGKFLGELSSLNGWVHKFSALPLVHTIR